MQKPKVLIFINTLRSGGAERVVTHLLHHLKGEFEFHVALYNQYIDYYIPENINILNLKQPDKENGIMMFLKMPLLSWKLYQYCKKNKIGTSVAFLNRPCYINGMMRFLFKYKGYMVMCERTHQSALLEQTNGIYSAISRRLVKFAYKRADLVLTNSYASKADLVENFHVTTPMRVIHNPVDLAFIQQQLQQPAKDIFESGIFHFVYVGGFRKEKNVAMLLQSVYLIRHLPVKLVIVGGGSQQQLLSHLVEELGIAGKILFCGFDSNPFPYIKASDCFVLSSLFEGFPNVLLEALACGKPIISTDCKSGPREILSPATPIHSEAFTAYEIVEYGILTPVNDVANMAAAMKRVFEDEPLRKKLSDAALTRAKDFDVQEIKQHFLLAFSS